MHEQATDTGQNTVRTEAVVAGPLVDDIRHRSDLVRDAVQKSSGNATVFLNKHCLRDEASGPGVLWFSVAMVTESNVFETTWFLDMRTV